MPRNYLISIGGTGARCLEATVYLAAAGIFSDAFQVLSIDADQNNGNSESAQKIAAVYHLLHCTPQPENPERSGFGFGSKKLPPPTVFRAAINRTNERDTRQAPLTWDNPNSADRKFADVIKYNAQPDSLKDFLGLFYSHDDLEAILDAGYRGRTNLGSVALKQDLENTLELPDNAFTGFLTKLNSDLLNGPTKVLVIASVFGGTGAAGLPTIPSVIDGLPPDGIVSKKNRENLRYGCVMITHYFSFPQNKNGDDSGPGTDSTLHPLATQAALMHYAHVPPKYYHTYLIGAPTRPETNDKNVTGGERQENKPHYVEIIAALAASDYFRRESVDINNRALHFADTIDDVRGDLGVTWDTLPFSHPDQREEVKRLLVTFTTFAYIYKHFLYKGLFSDRSYQKTAWYKDNFKAVTLDEQSQTSLAARLYDFSSSYLNWLREVGETAQAANTPCTLFTWDAFRDHGNNPELYGEYLGNLMGGLQVSPKFVNDGYDKIMAEMDKITLKQANTGSAFGLFTYLLYRAVAEFCKVNYSWR